MSESLEFFGGVESVGDSFFASFAGYGLLLLFVFCLIRRMPAATASIPFMSDGVSYATVTPVFSYVEWLIIVSVFVVGILITGSLKSERIGRVKGFLKLKPIGAVFLIMIYISFKSVIDVFWLGLDDSRKAGLLLLIPNVLLPLLIIIFSVPIYGLVNTLRQFMFGGYLGSLIWLATGLVGSLSDISLAEFFVGKRLTFHGSTMIHSVRLIPLFLWASIFWFLKVPRISVRIFIVVALGIVLTALSLNGTRQYALSVFAAMVFTAVLLPQRAMRIGLFGATAGIVAVLFLNNFWEVVPLRQRSTIDQVGSDGRLAIWSDSFEYASQRPWFGGGFRTYGEESVHRSLTTGYESLAKDNAHGLFADVAVDHGIIISICLAILYLLLCLHLFRLAIKLKNADLSLIVVGVIALPLSLLFSGTFWTAFYFAVPIAFVLWLPSYQDLEFTKLRIGSQKGLGSIGSHRH